MNEQQFIQAVESRLQAIRADLEEDLGPVELATRIIRAVQTFWYQFSLAEIERMVQAFDRLVAYRQFSPGDEGLREKLMKGDVERAAEAVIDWVDRDGLKPGYDLERLWAVIFEFKLKPIPPQDQGRTALAVPISRLALSLLLAGVFWLGWVAGRFFSAPALAPLDRFYPESDLKKSK